MALNVSILGVGFIGKNLLASCLDHEYNVRVLDRNQCPLEFKSDTNWIMGSFTNIDHVIRAVKGTDVVFHLISSTVPGDTVDENEEIFANVTQTINLLKICVQEKVSRVVFISSSSVYGVQEKLPISETANTNPISSHGIHKLTIEKYLQLYKFEYGLDCKIMRLTNPYGPHQNISGRQGFIAIAIGKIMRGEPIVIRGDGSSIRDFLHIDDVIQACHLLASTNSNEAVFNIGSGCGISLNAVIAEMNDIIGKPLSIKYIGERIADIPASILDIYKAENLLGYEPKHSLHSGLTSNLRHYGII